MIKSTLLINLKKCPEVRLLKNKRSEELKGRYL